MAIKVIKHGKETFKAVCPICGCEFTYQSEDLKEDCFHNHYVDCPDCKQAVSHEYEAKKKSITWTKALPVVDNKINYSYYPTTFWPYTPAWSDCTTCPNKPDPNKIIVGDTPCTWCYKNQPYCITGDNFSKEYTGGTYKVNSESYRDTITTFSNKLNTNYSDIKTIYTTDIKAEK